MTAEERFKELISGIAVEIEFPNVVRCNKKLWYYKNDKCLIYYVIKTRVSWIDYDEIWSVLSYEFKLNYDQIQELTTTILKQYLTQNLVTTKFIGRNKWNTPETTFQK